MPRTWFKWMVLLVGCIAMMGCATGVTTTAQLGFFHGEAVNKLDFSGDTTGWSAGGSIGFSFDEDGLKAVEPCAAGSFLFQNSSIDDDDLVISQNTIPISLCTEIETRPTRPTGDSVEP